MRWRKGDAAASGEAQIAASDISWRRLTAFAVVLSMLLLVVSLLPSLQSLLVGFSGHKVMESVLGEYRSWPTALLGRIVWFALAVIFVHLLVGLCALALTRLTYRAVPGAATRRRPMLAIWFIGLSLSIVLLSATHFPHSQLGYYYHDWAVQRIGPIRIVDIAALTTAGAVLWVIVASALRSRDALRINRRVAAYIGATGLVVGVLLVTARGESEPPTAAGKPHVILIGVDSLRTDMLQKFGGKGLAPNLDAELANAFLLRDAVTPLARTFPSWMSILTGRHPRTTGAWVNLIHRDRVAASPTLPELLREQGYRSIYATDEVRFANIDRSYGFDQTITPVMGASDFLLGTLNDLPVSNLIANTRMGEWLFPHTYTNRAAAATYDPAEFIERLDREATFQQPTLFVVHLTTPHWPYHTADEFEELGEAAHADAELKENSFALYKHGVRIADWQVGKLLEKLRNRGVLENALVVYLSDHGEAMKRPEDRLIKLDPSTGVGPGFTIGTTGHGTSVLSPVQFQVLLGIKGYGQFESRVAAGESNAPVSLEDLAPTILDLLETPHDQVAFDGRSLRSLLTGAPDAGVLHTRIRFTETDFNLPRMIAGEVNPEWLAMRTADYYSMDPENGWVHFREDRLDDVLAQKQMAAIEGEWLLAAMPALENKTSYVLANRRTGEYRMLTEAPDPAADPIAHRLWTALYARFPGALRTPKTPEAPDARVAATG